MRYVKTGFTLVEVAIVLVVIGVIVGMVIKGRSLIEASMVRADVLKVDKIQAAYSSYISNYEVRPGVSPANASEKFSTKAIYEDLILAGVVKSSDFKVEHVGTGYWGFVGCTSNIDNEFWIVNTAAISDYVCLAVLPNEPLANNSEAVVFVSELSGQLACYIEVMLDDKNTSTGNGRTMGLVGANLVDTDSCEKSVTTPIPYVYRIF